MKRRIVVCCFLWVAIAAAASAQSARDKFEKADAEAMEKVRGAWSEALSKAMEGRHLNATFRAFDEAVEAGATGELIDRVKESFTKGGSFAAPVPDAAEGQAIIKEAVSQAGAASESILTLSATDQQASRFALHLQRAVAADPKDQKMVQLHQSRTSAALSKKDWGTLRIYVMRAAELDPDGYRAGKYANAEAALAKNGGLVVRAPEHFMQAYVSLPQGWTPKKKWPLIVAVVGANCAYTSLMQELVTTVDKRPYVLMVPMTISNANELPFDKLPYSRSLMARFENRERQPQRLWSDVRGLLSLLDEMERRYSTNKSYCMTGYSGGGFLTYTWLLHYPDRLQAACLGSANFWEYAENDVKKAENGGCPVLIVTGERDSAGSERIFPQAAQGLAALGRAGYTRVDRRHLPNRDHEPFYELGLEVFDKAQAEAKKR